MNARPFKAAGWVSTHHPVKPRPLALDAPPAPPAQPPASEPIALVAPEPFALVAPEPLALVSPACKEETLDDADILEIGRSTLPMPMPMPGPRRAPPPPISSPIPLVRRARPHQPLRLDLGNGDPPEGDDALDDEDVEVDVSRFLPKRRAAQWVTCLLAIGIAVGLWRDPSARARALQDARALDPRVADALAAPRPHGKHAIGASRVATSLVLEPVSTQPSFANVDWNPKPKRR
jgi:hypothetical protein